MRIWLLFAVCIVWIRAEVLPVDIMPKLKNNHFMGIKILDQKQLTFQKIDSVAFLELSDVAYDGNTKTLYFVGDKGTIYDFFAVFSQKIERLQPLSAVNLKNSKSKRLRKWNRDAEGLTLDGKGRLLLSFEGDARVAWFHKNSLKKGSQIRTYILPKTLRQKKNYRSINKSLEALAWHKKHGILIAAEWPLKKYDKKTQTIYSLWGQQWHFKSEKEDRTGVVAMEVMDDGNLLVLERSYTGILMPFVVTLKKVFLNQCKKQFCKTEIVAKLNSHEGWRLDNFEGLAKVGKNRYVIVSDNGNNFFQKTLLIYFEVLG